MLAAAVGMQAEHCRHKLLLHPEPKFWAKVSEEWQCNRAIPDVQAQLSPFPHLQHADGIVVFGPSLLTENS